MVAAPDHSLHPRAAHETLEVLLTQQEGVARLSQLRRWLSDVEVRGEVDAGRWRRFCRGVVITHNADPTPAQLRWAHLLGAPPGSALAGLTAAGLDGLVGFDVPEVYVVVPAGSRKPKRQGSIVWASTRLGPEAVHPRREPRRTRTGRSVVDAASATRLERRCRALVLASVQQRLVRPRDLAEALLHRGRCRHHALIGECIADAEGGVASVPEREFDDLRRRFGLPEPDRQVVVRRSDGRYYLDVEWRRRRLACEVHGIQHLELLTWDSDLERMGEIVARGRRVLPFTSYAIRHQPERVGTLLCRAYDA